MLGYKEILDNKITQDFYRESVKYGAYCRCGMLPSRKKYERYINALSNYRIYLDSIGCYMTPPRRKIR